MGFAHLSTVLGISTVYGLKRWFNEFISPGFLIFIKFNVDQLPPNRYNWELKRIPYSRRHDHQRKFFRIFLLFLGRTVYLVQLLPINHIYFSYTTGSVHWSGKVQNMIAKLNQYFLTSCITCGGLIYYLLLNHRKEFVQTPLKIEDFLFQRYITYWGRDSASSPKRIYSYESRTYPKSIFYGLRTFPFTLENSASRNSTC